MFYISISSFKPFKSSSIQTLWQGLILGFLIIIKLYNFIIYFIILYKFEHIIVICEISAYQIFMKSIN